MERLDAARLRRSICRQRCRRRADLPAPVADDAKNRTDMSAAICIDRETLPETGRQRPLRRHLGRVGTRGG